MNKNNMQTGKFRFQSAAACFFILSVFIFSCDAGTSGNADSVSVGKGSLPDILNTLADDTGEVKTQPKAQVAPAAKIEVSVFEIRDKSGRLGGYGYDLIVNGKKSIHQDMIPAIPGNIPFYSEQDAKAVGELAAAKMRKGADLPGITVKELDSLKIIH